MIKRATILIALAVGPQNLLLIATSTMVATTLLATTVMSGTPAQAGERWKADFRQCHIRKWFSKDELADIGWPREAEGQTIVIELEDVPDIERGLRELKKCKAFLQCLGDREKGKVKHCYENDKRWR